MATFIVLGDSQPAHHSEIKQNGRVQNQQDLTCLHVAWGMETLSNGDVIFQRTLNNCYVICFHRQALNAGSAAAAAAWPTPTNSCSQSFSRYEGSTDKQLLGNGQVWSAG